MKRTASQITADLRAAGFNGAQATIMTAIALAESAGDDTALGDVALQDGSWGASYGLYQIRTLKAQTGTGADRDVTWLAASDAHQAKAAYDISRHGTDFSPWTTYTRGTYQQFLGQAAVPTAVRPVSWLSDVGGGVRDTLIEAVFVVLGLGLVGYGLWRAAR